MRPYTLDMYTANIQKMVDELDKMNVPKQGRWVRIPAFRWDEFVSVLTAEFNDMTNGAFGELDENNIEILGCRITKGE